MKIGTIYRAGKPIVWQALMADDPWSRVHGLLLRPTLRGDAEQAIWLSDRNIVHTVGMCHALDAVFLDQRGTTIGWRENLRPWRMHGCKGATQAIALAPGGITTLAPTHGEIWEWRATLPLLTTG